MRKIFMYSALEEETMCCSIPNELLEKEGWRKLRQIRREIELYEKNRKEISDTFQKLEVERKKIDESLGELWYEFRRLYTKVLGKDKNTKSN